MATHPPKPTNTIVNPTRKTTTEPPVSVHKHNNESLPFCHALSYEPEKHNAAQSLHAGSETGTRTVSFAGAGVAPSSAGVGMGPGDIPMNSLKSLRSDATDKL